MFESPELPPITKRDIKRFISAQPQVGDNERKTQKRQDVARAFGFVDLANVDRDLVYNDPGAPYEPLLVAEPPAFESSGPVPSTVKDADAKKRDKLYNGIGVGLVLVAVACGSVAVALAAADKSGPGTFPVPQPSPESTYPTQQYAPSLETVQPAPQSAGPTEYQLPVGQPTQVFGL